MLISKSAAFVLQAKDQITLASLTMKIAYPLLVALALTGACGQSIDNAVSPSPSPEPTTEALATKAPITAPITSVPSPSLMDDMNSAGWTGAMNGTGNGSSYGNGTGSGYGRSPNSSSGGNSSSNDNAPTPAKTNVSDKTVTMTLSAWIVIVSVVLSLV